MKIDRMLRSLGRTDHVGLGLALGTVGGFLPIEKKLSRQPCTVQANFFTKNCSILAKTKNGILDF